MNRLEALVALNLAGEIGTIRLRRLLEYFNTPQDILGAPQEKIIAVSGISTKIAAKIRALKQEDIDKEFVLAGKLGLKIITQDDKEYPENLKHIPDPPLLLYIKGELKKEDRLAVAIVGSRRASFYGLKAAEKFAAELTTKGFTIISGMARGVDTYAHRGALKARGRTIAVIGSGFNNIYPQENQGLAEEIARAGAVISEFPVNMQPLKQNFPCRNRLISGLSLGVLVTEAARNSGALITADFALEQGREVFAVPGKIDSDNSFGTNNLIRQGAKLVSGVEDILEEFFGPAVEAEKEKAEPKENISVNPGNNAEEKIYALISGQPVQLDELVEKTNLAIPVISDILLRLQMKKIIQQLPGKYFISHPALSERPV